MADPPRRRRSVRSLTGRWVGVLLRTRIRKVITLVVVVLLVVTVLNVAGSAGSEAPVRTSDVTITAAGGPGVDAPVDLDATLYVPEVIPAPAVIVAHGFGGSKASVDADARRLAQAGFVAIAYSARGFGNSTGQIGLDSLDYEVPDARAVVDWLATRPEVQLDAPGDPRVGVTGPSYGGALSLMLAGTDSRIDAVAPVITWNDLSQALFPNAVASGGGSAGGPTPAAVNAGPDGVFKKAWASSLIASVTTGTPLQTSGSGTAVDNGDSGFGLNSADNPDAPAQSPDTAQAAATAGAADLLGSGCGRLMATVCAAYGQAAQTGRLDPALAALLDRSSPKAVVQNIKAPTLLIQGERDTLFGLDQADANARAIAAAGTPVAVTWYTGGHDGGTPDPVTENRITAWFDYYLAGSGGVPSDDFLYSVNGPLDDEGNTRIRTLQAPGYPGLAGQQPTDRAAVPLTGDPQVVSNPPGGSPAAISSIPGVSGLAGSLLSSSAGGLPGQTARFTSAPVSALTVIAGSPRITVSISAVPRTGGADGSDTGAVLFASLSKVTATGVVTLAGGAVAPIRVSDLPADGTPRQVPIDLPAVAFQVEAGSSIQVSLSTTDQAYSGSTDPATYRIALADGTALSLPEVGGVRISAGDVPAGKLIALIILAALLLLALAFGGRVRRPTRRAGAAPARRQLPDSDTSGGGPSETPLVITGLEKSYPGGVAAVRDVSLRVERGQVLGLLGPNGAGKTTVLRMVMGLIVPTAGDIEVFGRPITPGAEILSRVGSFVEGSGFLPHLSGRTNLDLYWRATSRPAADAHIEQALEIAGLGGAVRRKVKTYSQGMRQRLAIAQAMLGLPDLLILDEPTNGLDPPQIHAMRQVLRQYAATGRTVVVSSHLLSEVEQTCSHVVVMNQGRTIASGTVQELVSGPSGSATMLFVVDDEPAAIAVLEGLDGIGKVTTTTEGVRADLGTVPGAAAIAALVTAGIQVSSAGARHRLEDVFLELVGASGGMS